MTTHTQLRLGAVAVVLLAVVLLSGAHLCGAALDRANDPGMRPIGTGALACTEFWLNRYQTLIGAVAALIAAGIAWIGIRRQIDKADEQISVGIRQSSIAILPILDQRTESAIKAFRSATALESLNSDMFKVSQFTFARAGEISEQKHFGEMSPRNLTVFKDSLRQYILRIDAFDDCLGKMTDEIARGLGGPSFQQAGQDIWVCAADILSAHRSASDELKALIDDDARSIQQTNGSFYFDNEIFAAMDRIYAKSIEILSKEAIIMQNERDRFFEQSRS